MKGSLLLLLGWLIIGMSCRLMALSAKPPWTDEFSTMVFSLGNSFTTVPLDRVISLAELMQPLQPQPMASAADVIRHLLTESNHPPLYFVLAHGWMQLFPIDSASSLLFVARLLPALLGALAIPSIYGLGWLAFRSRLVAHLAAAMMAVSPFGIFLAQEARHYTLSILWAIASLACLIVAVRSLAQRRALPGAIALIWVTINWLGIATHYFFALTLAAEAMVLLVVGWRSRGKSRFFPIVAVAIASLMGGLVWLPLWNNGLGSELTAWIANDSRTGFEWLQPIFQAIAAWLTMLSLLPVEAANLALVLISGVMMTAFFLWALPILLKSLEALVVAPESRLVAGSLVGFVAGAIGQFFAITYFLGIDLTRGARYNFVYFPAVILLVGACLALCWNSTLVQSQWFNFPAVKTPGKRAVMIILLMGLISSLTVVFNLGYQKYYRPDLLASAIATSSQSTPLLIATTHQTHVQIGEMMGVGWEFQRQQIPIQPQFLLAHQEREALNSTQVLQQTLANLPRPLDLWLLNFHAPIELAAQNCFPVEQDLPPIDGYETQFYRCQ